MICPGCGKRVPDDGFALCAECDAERGIRHERHTEETVADIVAELRSCPTSTVLGVMVSLLCNRLADRIETAWKREKAEIEASALAAGGIVEASRHKQVGNAAAMRAALIKTQSAIARCMDILNKIPDTCGYGGLIDDAADELCALQEMHLKSALSAPARNCDVGTAEEQEERFNKFCDAHSCNECPARGRWRTVYIDGTSFKMIQCGILWAQMPYEPDTKKEERNDAE